MNKKSKNTEVWKPVRGLENYIAVSNHGRVLSKARPVSYPNGLKKTKEDKILTPRKTRGYFYVRVLISDGEFRFSRNIAVHRLVAQEFCANRLGFNEVNHKDGNKENNHASNLEWVSRSENILHAVSMGLRGKPTGNRKFSEEQIAKVFELRKQQYRHKEIAEELGMGVSTVTHILLGSRRNDKIEEYRAIHN